MSHTITLCSLYVSLCCFPCLHSVIIITCMFHWCPDHGLVLFRVRWSGLSANLVVNLLLIFNLLTRV